MKISFNSPLIWACGLVLFVSGCAQTSSSESAANTTTETQSDGTVKKDVKTAARFVVGRVAGTPVRAAMAAEGVAEAVAKKASGSQDTAADQNQL